MENNKVAGGIIKGLHETVGISQADLAKRAGVNRAEISLYENGKRDPRVSTFMRLLSALGYVMIVNKKGF